MAKELPYFRFTVSEWLNGDISFESYELKGLFIDICAWYWFKDCIVTIAMLKKKFSNATENIDALIDAGVIKEDGDDAVIFFLNEQYDLLSSERKKRVEAGRLGGKRKASNAKALIEQSPSYKDKNNNILLSNDESLDVKTSSEKFTKKPFLDVLESEFGDKVNLEYYKIAKGFQLLFIRNAKELMKSDKEPAISKSKFKTVYDPIRLVIETDGASLEDVRKVYKYLANTKNDFWKKNCQSTDKLRKQFDRLLIEATKHEGTN